MISYKVSSGRIYGCIGLNFSMEAHCYGDYTENWQLQRSVNLNRRHRNGKIDGNSKRCGQNTTITNFLCSHSKKCTSILKVSPIYAINAAKADFLGFHVPTLFAPNLSKILPPFF